MKDLLKRKCGAHANRRMRRADQHSYAKWRYYFWNHLFRTTNVDEKLMLRYAQMSLVPLDQLYQSLEIIAKWHKDTEEIYQELISRIEK